MTKFDIATLLSGTEGHHFERKSLRLVTGKSADWEELAKDVVCFANASGGIILVGIEDGQAAPPEGQCVPPDLVDQLHKRIGECTVNVQVVAEPATHDNGAEYVALRVLRSQSVASTTDGRYFLRVGDTRRPIVGDEVIYLIEERPRTPWENLVAHGVTRDQLSRAKTAALTSALRASGKVSPSVREKSDPELLDHYGLCKGEAVTHLGVLLLGERSGRADLGTAPVVQAVKYDAHGAKIQKWCWDDYLLAPHELVEAIWREIPDFRESYEVSEGLFRTSIPVFDEAVVRELLVNALVHRPYTQRGDIFLNLHPDRLEVVNPGRLPLGITPRNILQDCRRRNEGLAKVFHDLKLMEREGSGIDLVYERLLVSGRPAPTFTEGTDRLTASVPRLNVRPEIKRLVTGANQRFKLTQRERIALALLAQSEGLSIAELAHALGLSDQIAARPWITRLVDWGLLHQAGRTRGMRYSVPPALLRDAGLDNLTTLRLVQPHRLRALILEDIARYPGSGRTDIHRRIGPEIHEKSVTRALKTLLDEGGIVATGERRWRVYRLVDSHARSS